jgi:hypothetical protein
MIKLGLDVGELSLKILEGRARIHLASRARAQDSKEHESKKS